jgi:hypothetical protein
LKNRLRKINSFIFLSVMLALVVAANGQGVDLGGKGGASSGLPGQNPHSFIGTWIVQTQITNCFGTTLENLSKLTSINAGGTVQDTSNSNPWRSAGFGVWEHLHQTDFVYAIQFFRFTPDGTFAGSVQAEWSVLMGEDGNSYSAEGDIQLVSPNGFVIAILCGAETGTRMVIPN